MVLLKLPYRALSLLPKRLFQDMRSTRHLLWPRLPLQGESDTDPGAQAAFSAQFSLFPQPSTEGPEPTHTCSRCCAEGRWQCQVRLVPHLVSHVYDALLKTHTHTHPTSPTRFPYFRFFYPLLQGSQESLFHSLQTLCDGAELCHSLDQLLPAAQQASSQRLFLGCALWGEKDSETQEKK